MKMADPAFFNRKHKPSRIIAAILVLMLVCQPFVLFADELALPSPDVIAPDGEHNPISGALAAGQNLTINARVVDNVGVASVTLFYRIMGTDSFNPIGMAKSDGDNYTVTVKGDFVEEPGIEYYIQAQDKAGNTRTFGYKFSPYIVKVTPDGIDKPGIADTDLTDGTREGDSSMALVGGTSGDQEESSAFSNKWLWIGLGVLALGALAGGGGGGGGDKDGKGSNTGTIVISGPGP